MSNIKKIAITGPESTGKSWLAERLAYYFLTTWVPEYSREYLAGLGRPYDYDDILKIAKGQLENENKVIEGANRYLFCDTDMIVNKIWCNVRYGKCHPWIEEQVLHHSYDLYLLMDSDLPWVADPLREHPEMRDQIFVLYENELKNNNFPYRIIRGTGKARLVAAVELIEDIYGDHGGSN